MIPSRHLHSIFILFLLLAFGCDSADTRRQEDADNALRELSERIDSRFGAKEDSLIRMAGDYYMDKGLSRELMWCFYFRGEERKWSGRLTDAILNYRKAYNMAAHFNDHRMMGTTALEIGRAYDRCGHYSEGLQFTERALDHFQKSGDQELISKSYLEIGTISLGRGDYKKALSLIHKSKDIADTRSILKAGFMSRIMLLAVYGKLGMRDSFEYVLNDLGLTHEDFMTDDENEEVEILRQMLLAWDPSDISNDSAYVETLGQLEAATGTPALEDHRKAVEKRQRNKEELEDPEVWTARQSGLEDSMRSMFSREIRERDEKLKDSQLLIIFIICLSVVAIGVAVCWILRYRRHLRHQLDSKINMVAALEKDLSAKDSKYAELELRFQSSLSRRLSAVNSMCRAYYESQAIPGIRGKISREIEALVEELRTPDFLNDIVSVGDKIHDGRISRLRRDYPAIRPTDYALFAYHAAGFSNAAIALIIDEDKLEALYNRKSRLRRKLTKALGPEAEPYTDILNAR